MLIRNTCPDFGAGLDPRDVACLDHAAVADVDAYLATRVDHRPSPLRQLPSLAAALGVGAIDLKDESGRLGLGSFKALGGAYAVFRLVLEEAGRRLARELDYAEIDSPEVRAIAASLTFCCATDGNHGRSVAQGTQRVGARCVVFVHAGVSEARVAAMTRFGAKAMRIDGTYDDSVSAASDVAAEQGWVVVSDTAWPGYERIPGMVMQGYTAMAQEIVQALPQAPTHVFVQAGVGGLAAAVAGHFALAYGGARPVFVVVEPDRAACLYEAARLGRPARIEHGLPTVMSMLECYEPSLVAWRVLSRVADAFMLVEEQDAVSVMNRLGRPVGGDPVVVSGESGGVGLAGLIRIASDPDARAAIRLGADARVLVINTEGATDPERYAELTGLPAA